MTFSNLPETRPDALEAELGEFLEIIGEIGRAKDEVRERYEDLVRAWEDSWGWFRRNIVQRDTYDEEREAIEAIWDRIAETRLPDGEAVAGSILELSQRVIDHHFPVLSLFRTSSAWVTQVYTPTSEVSAEVWNPEHSRALVHWDTAGEARQAYDEIRDHQQESVAAMVTVANDISVWLSDVATGNVEFTTTLLSHLGGIANTLISETGKLANTAGLSALWTSAEVIGEVVKTALDVLSTAANNIALMATQTIEADRIIGDHSHFPDGDWPHAVSRP